MRRAGKHYTYNAVTHNGAGVDSTHETLGEAKAAMQRHALRWADTLSRHPEWGWRDVIDFEIERVEHVTEHSVRYQMRKGSRWVEWDPHQGAEARRPDFWAQVKEDGTLEPQPQP